MVVGEFTRETNVLVIGAGPGGYAAAFRAADLGFDVIMVNCEEKPGGTCLLRGCIPSKTLLHASEVLLSAREAAEMGIIFNNLRVELDTLRSFKNQVIDKLSGGLIHLSRKRGIELITAKAVFESSREVLLQDTTSDVRRIRFQHAILAAGSSPAALPGIAFKEGGRIMSSDDALELRDIPNNLLVVGGGYLGLELGYVYAALGSRVTVVEMMSGLLLGADRDMVDVLSVKLESVFEAIHLNAAVRSMQERVDEVSVAIEKEDGGFEKTFERVLVAVGRRPNSKDIGLENTDVEVDGQGFVQVDERQRTRDEHIYAVGDIVGGVQLAHKAFAEGRIAAEVLAGLPSAFDVRTIPQVLYTNPEVAWCGLTEDEAKQEQRPVKVSRFPWAALGRAAAMGLPSGMTKMIMDPETGQILGAGIVGRGADELISETALAVEMGAVAEDVALTIHPHPTLSESIQEAAAVFLGSATDVLPQNDNR